MIAASAALLIGTWTCKAYSGKDPVLSYTITYRSDGTSTSLVAGKERTDTYVFAPASDDEGLLRYTTGNVEIEFPVRVRWKSHDVMTFSDFAASTDSPKEPFATCVRS